MSANRIFLVCSHHPQLEHALLLCERAPAHALHELSFSTHADMKRASTWFEKHSKCGNPDDFQLAFNRPPNWDVSPPAQNTVAGGVRMGIINGSKQ